MKNRIIGGFIMNYIFEITITEWDFTVLKAIVFLYAFWNAAAAFGIIKLTEIANQRKIMKLTNNGLRNKR